MHTYIHTILYCTILYYTIPYHTIPYHIIPYHTILYYTILYYTILYYTILYSGVGVGLRPPKSCVGDVGRTGQLPELLIHMT